MTDTTEPTPDLLYGAPRIAEYLGLTPAAVYHLAAQRRIPTFRLGKTVCARRSTLAKRIEQLESELSAA